MASKRKGVRQKSAEEAFEEALYECNELYKKGKKSRKPITYRIHRDPVTGERQTRTPYRPRFQTSCRSKQDGSSSSEAYPLEVEDFDEGEVSTTGGSSDWNGTSLEQALRECQDVLEESAPLTKYSWERRMHNLSENWDGCRKELFEGMLKRESPQSGRICTLCGENELAVRCSDCLGVLAMCFSCDEYVHEKLPFHDRRVFVNGFYQPVPPTTSLDRSGHLKTVARHLPLATSANCPHCNGSDVVCTAAPGTLIVVTLKGRFDLDCSRMCCSTCNEVLPQCSLNELLNAGYWPGSPSDTTHIFDQSLFEMWDILQKRMPGTSENSFIRGLEDFSSSRGRAPTINTATFSRSFKEWKFCHHELDLLSYCNWMKCPPCSIEQHSCHVDGNMKLYRFKTSGVQRRPSYYGDLFIANKSEVDDHLKKVYSKQSRGKASYNKCGNSQWRAANNKVTKKAKQDETGLEIAGCRHGLAQWAVNMYYGELYGYAHFIQQKKMLPAQVKYFWEDVVCQYWKWAQKVDGVSTSAWQMIRPAGYSV